jgi:Ca2+-binding RTX toxin-like protein
MTPRTQTGRRALALVALAAAVLASSLAYGTDEASAAYTARIEGGTLLVLGNGSSDVLHAYASSATVDLDVGGDGTVEHTFDRAALAAIDIRGGGGNDEIRLIGSGFAEEAVTIRGDSGNDTIAGGIGEQTIYGGAGNDTVAGGFGIDRVLLGAGADHVSWNPGDSNDVIDGEAGVDTLAFNGSAIGEIIDVSALGGRIRFTRNVASIALDLGGIETVGFNALGGADTVDVHDLTGTGARSVEVTLSADAQADVVTAHGTDGPNAFAFASAPGSARVTGGSVPVVAIGGEALHDKLAVAAAGGDDTITSGAGVAGPVTLGADGGAGLDTVRYNGTAQADTIVAVANGAFAAVDSPGSSLLDTSVESVVLLGLAGNDTIAAVGNLAALTTLTLDGGDGDDDVRGGNGPDLLLGGRGLDLVDGNQGADRALLGNDADTFRWDPGDGSDVVDGGAGTDALAFNGSAAAEVFGISPLGDHVLFTRNIANVALDLDAIEHVGLSPFGGTDLVNAYELTGTDARSVDVTLADDGVVDTVLAHGTDAAETFAFAASPAGVTIVRPGPDVNVGGGEAAFDSVDVAAAGGDDMASTTFGVLGPRSLGFDGGEGFDTVRFDGTAGPDTIPAVANGAFASVAAPGTSLVNALAESLVLLGHDGDDSLSAVGNLAALTTLTLDGGEGEDRVSGGNGADRLLGGPGNDHVDGNQGVDEAALGAGDDTFQWDPGDGNDVVDGQAGADSLAFNAGNVAEILQLSAWSGHVLLTRNIAAITMDLDGIETVGVFARGGADTLWIGDLSGTDVDAVDVDLSLFPGGDPDTETDTVVVNGRAARDVVDMSRIGSQAFVTGLPARVRVGGPDLADVLRVHTLDGDDDVTVAADVSTLLTPVVDLGGGE